METDSTKHLEEIWVRIGTETKYWIGVVYAPQGDKARVKDQREIYKGIGKNIKKGKENGDKIMIMGDFNAKVGDMIEQGDTETNRGGKQLRILIKENRMEIVNGMRERKGTWTRIEKGKKAVLDYIMIEEKESHGVTEINIDEEKLWTPHYVTNEGNEMFTDHCAITCKIKWKNNRSEEKKNKERWVMTKRGYEKFREQMERRKVAKIMEGEGTVKEVYDKMVKEIMEIKKKCQTKMKHKKEKTPIRQLMRIKRRLKKGDQENNKIRIKMINKHIMNKKRNQYKEKIERTIEQLRRDGGGVKEQTFWEFKRRMEGRKEEQKTGMKDSNGEIRTETGGIKKIFENFYQELFKKPEWEKENMKIKEAVERKVEGIMERAKQQGAMRVTTEVVRKVVRNLKKRKAGDIEGWKNEMISGGGEEMVKTLTGLFNKILTEMETPRQWEEMRIKSIYKNKGKRTEMTNRRGIFLTSVVGKVFEKTVLRTIEKDIKLGRFQNGGRKGRSTKDNFLTIMAVIDRDKEMGLETTMLFADAEKCFDKLWLEDCIVDMVGCGMREREAALLYQMNQRANIKILTPFGETDEIKVERIVKQGTIFGPLLCCGNTARINHIGEVMPATFVTKDKAVGALVYVDDIGMAGSKRVIEETGRNLGRMEKEKRFTFNIEKTNTMTIGKRKEKETAKVELKRESEGGERIQIPGKLDNQQRKLGKTN